MPRPALPLLAAFVSVLAGCNCGGPDASDAGVPSDSGPGTIAAPLACQDPFPADAPYGNASCPVDLPAASDLLDDALAVTGLDRCTLGWDPSDNAIFGPDIDADPWRLPFYDTTHDAAPNAPVWARRTLDRFDGAIAGPTPVASAIAAAADRLGFGAAAATCTGAYGVSETAPLAAALIEFFGRLGVATSPADLDMFATTVAAVPADLQTALAPVIVALADAALARDAVFGPFLTNPIAWSQAWRLGPSLVIPAGFARFDPTDPFWAALITDPAFDELYAAATRLALTIEAAGLGAFAGATGFSVTIPSPIGTIVLRDAADDTYDPADPDLAGDLAFILDTGGDDVYLVAAGANTSSFNSVSVAIDLDGSDTYGYVEVPDPNDGTLLPSDEDGRYVPLGTPTTDNGPVSISGFNRQGAGRLGFAFLFDLGADDDHYQSLRMSQGFGTLGVGALFDDGGNDVYLAEDGAHGAGVFGIGLLIDAGGDDRYESFAFSQGFGYVYGLGLLHDAGGADVYDCDIGDPAWGGTPLYLSAQLPGTGNSSFCQGAGFGRRSDPPGGDGVYMSGGIGVLRDRGSGGDLYTSSVFGTGTGYWFGTGVLSDEGGDDWYDGRWYVQGSTAHFALSIFWDEDGADLYDQGETVCDFVTNPACSFAPAATSIGVGHDFSLTWHIDGGGDDVYLGPGLSLGAGNVNGIGVMVNLGGADTYVSMGDPNSPTLGAANLFEGGSLTGPRRDIVTAGIFVDSGGVDSYELAGMVMPYDDASWERNVATMSMDPTLTSEHGVGLDGTGTVTLVP